MNDITRRKYKKSPIAEVLCVITFEELSKNSLFLDNFYAHIFDEYPDRQSGKNIRIENINVEGGKSVPEIIESEATRFLTKDRSKIIQVVENTIIFNNVEKPYPGFESFRENSISVFETYGKIIKAKSFDRLELRYINQFSNDSGLDIDLTEIHDFFNFVPKTDESIGHFQFQFQVKPFYKEHFLFATIAILPLSNNKDVTVQIDIQNIYLKNNVVDVKNIERLLDNAHENIGRVFEKIITNKTRKLLEEVENDKCEW